MTATKKQTQYTDRGNLTVCAARAAELMGVSVQTVCRWMDRGMIPGHKLPGGETKPRRRLLVRDILSFSAPYPEMHERVKALLRRENVEIKENYYLAPMTVGQVAKVCQVAPRTVTKWCDSEGLQSYRIPGSRDRRILVRSLVAFANKNGLPLREIMADLGLGGGRLEEDIGSLVMKMQKGESIIIDGNIEVSIEPCSPIKNYKVRIRAPKSLPVERVSS